MTLAITSTTASASDKSVSKTLVTADSAFPNRFVEGLVPKTLVTADSAFPNRFVGSLTARADAINFFVTFSIAPGSPWAVAVINSFSADANALGSPRVVLGAEER